MNGKKRVLLIISLILTALSLASPLLWPVLYKLSGDNWAWLLIGYAFGGAAAVSAALSLTAAILSVLALRREKHKEKADGCAENESKKPSRGGSVAFTVLLIANGAILALCLTVAFWSFFLR